MAENWVSQNVIVCEPASFSCQFWRNQLSVELLIYVAAAVSGAIVARVHHRNWILANLTVIVRPLSVFVGGMWALRSDFRSAP